MLHHPRHDNDRRVEGRTRDEVCLRYQPKVLFLARRLHARLSPDRQVPVDELAAVGAVGLLEAFDRFDDARGIQFATFAEHRIRGAMYDALRENDSLGRRRRALSKRVVDAADHLRRQSRRDPSAREVADHLGISVDAYHAAMDRTKPVVHVPLDSPDADGGALSERIADTAHGPLSGLVVDEVRDALTRCVYELPERQRQCVILYYGNELTLAEIGQVFGVTPARISQILTETRARLRKRVLALVEVDGIEHSLARVGA